MFLTGLDNSVNGIGTHPGMPRIFMHFDMMA